MTTLSFPQDPLLNEPYTFEGRTWFWNGVAWKLDGVAGSAPIYPANTLAGNLTGSPAALSSVNAAAVKTWLNLVFGTAAGTYCEGNDARLSDARNPLTHTHGNISNDGAIGTTADLPISTTASGVINTRTVADFRGLLGLATTDSPTFAGLTATSVTTATVTSPSNLTSIGTAGNPALLVASSTDVRVRADCFFGFASTAGNVFTTVDVRLFRDAAGILAQRNGTNSQISRIYKTFTSATNAEFAELDAAGNATTFDIAVCSGSVGGSNRGLRFGRKYAGATTLDPWLTFETDGSVLFGSSNCRLQTISTGNDLRCTTHLAAASGLWCRSSSIGNRSHGIDWDGTNLILVTNSVTVASFRNGSSFGLTLPNNLTVGGAITSSGQSLTGSQDDSLVSLATTWNTTGTPTAFNQNVTWTAAANDSSLFRLQVDNATRFDLRFPFGKAGPLCMFMNSGAAGTFFFFENNQWGFRTNGQDRLVVRQTGLTLMNNQVLFEADGSNIWAQRNGTNAQISRIYKTFTSSTNFETLEFDASSDASNYRIGSRIGSAGGTTRGLHFGNYNAAGSWSSSFVIGTTGNIQCNGQITVLGDLTIIPSSSRTLSTNGQFSIEMTSNTAGNLVYRGSDGTTRRAGIPITNQRLLAESFAAYDENSFGYPITNVTYTGDLVTAITYTAPDASTYTRTFGYTSGRITTITLSGAIPAGVPTVKTITYTGNLITATSYA